MIRGEWTAAERHVMRHWKGSPSSPLVTVICHAFNQVHYVEKTLKEVLSQKTNFPFEIVVRDDASEDGTTGVIRRFEKLYPNLMRPVYERENAFRKGVKPIAVTFPMARGRYVAFCEGDDYWVAEEKLQMQVDFLESHPEYGAVHGNYLRAIRKTRGGWKAEVAVRNEDQIARREGCIYSSLLLHNTIQTCTFMCRSSLMADYRNLGPGVDCYPIGDWPLFLYIAHESKIGFIRKPIAVYRKAPGSITNSGDAAAISRAFAAVKMISEFCDFFGTDDGLRWQAEGAQYRSVLWRAVRAGDHAGFDKSWEWLEKYRPGLTRTVRARCLRLGDRIPVFGYLLIAALNMIEGIKILATYRSLGP